MRSGRIIAQLASKTPAAIKSPAKDEKGEDLRGANDMATECSSMHIGTEFQNKTLFLRKVPALPR
ncbi:hypothetical protein GCM10023213_36910 [Prosthecobacter algae]|uniref:Uncharacterized protein n=1 Tax=Prosthecobacter algae TaxID=1144682 RepID=A0ABP9PID0_9BACT